MLYAGEQKVYNNVCLQVAWTEPTEKFTFYGLSDSKHLYKNCGFTNDLIRNKEPQLNIGDKITADMEKEIRVSQMSTQK